MLKAANEQLLLEATQELTTYKTMFPSEDGDLACLSNRLLAHSIEDCFDRKSFSGHITTSGFVVDVALKKILFVDHSFLKMPLQPGGHAERDLALWLSAVREVMEECGVASIQRHPWTALHNCPFDIDTHSIPENVSKGEREHLHFDFGYLLIGDSTARLQKQEEEVEDVFWGDLKLLDTLPGARFRRVKRKLIELGIFHDADFHQSPSTQVIL